MNYQEWKEKKARERAAEAAEFEPTASEQPAPVALADAPELFQWTEDRERAIQELLETTVPGTLPAVHIQLQAIRHALVGGNLPKDRAQMLLDEVDGYLRGHEQLEGAKARVDHPGVTQARDEKARALAAWRESCSALREYLNNGEAVYLEVAAYAGDQGSAFLAASRRIMLQSEPEPEPEEDEE